MRSFPHRSPNSVRLERAPSETPPGPRGCSAHRPSSTIRASRSQLGLDVATTGGLLDVSPPAARAALEVLADAGILRRADLLGTGGTGRPLHWWVAGELLDLLTR
jgi:hypothetical protein